jgi:DNA-binding transcriptional ArsR family regulator
MAAHGDLLHIDERHALALREDAPSQTVAEQVAARYRALGDPTRLALARSLRGGEELCVCDLSWIVQRPQNLVSHHMQILRRAEIVTARREGKMTMYRLTGHGRVLLDAAGAETAGTAETPDSR